MRPYFFRSVDLNKFTHINDALPKYGYRSRTMFFSGVVLGRFAFGVLREVRGKNP